MKRLFIATKIELEKPFLDLEQNLKRYLANDKIVWVEGKLQHLTHRFLGQTPDAQISKLKQMLNHLGQNFNAFDLEMNKLGVFGSRYAPSVLWLGFKEFSAYEALFNDLESRLLELGFEPNYGNVVPHITLGRIKETQSKNYFWEVIDKNKPQFSQKISITEITLFQSRLQPSGPIYIPLHTVKLR